MAVDANGNEIIIQPAQEPNRAQERITELSDKVKTEAEGRVAAEAKVAVAERNAAFAEGYADIVVTNPAAKEFKADIKAKVDSGLSVEDATYAVLGKAGKLGAPKAPDPVNPAGGSATTSPPQGGTKGVAEMTQAERRAQLEKDIIWN